ncbi:hypothetical protein F4810DRAFT_681982 [Camillea tinctor]|nr:hypothetical protein F4810DRAFT_681982 [Camillea tinctor]
MTSSGKPRRSHNKSRKGCTECKRRHIKCDEQRPMCVNCHVSKRRCDYHNLVPQVPVQPQTSLISVEKDPCSGMLINSPQLLFALEHFSLFHHVETGLHDWFGITEAMRPLAQICIKAALRSPYLMHQLLAIAALHLGRVHPSGNQDYRCIATELQNRGLLIFRKTRDDSDPTTRFLFSSLVAVHVLAEMVAGHESQDVNTFLSEFIDKIDIHQGARIVGQPVWTEIRNSELKDWFSRVEEDQMTDAAYISRSQKTITSMLQSSRLDEEGVAACTAASKALDFSRRRLHSRGSWGPHAPLGWINMIPQEFVSLLKDGVPEALVVMAHYAQLLHECRDFWVFGNVGEYLIRGIAANLGPPWAEWLKIPVDALAEATK